MKLNEIVEELLLFKSISDIDKWITSSRIDTQDINEFLDKGNEYILNYAKYKANAFVQKRTQRRFNLVEEKLHDYIEPSNPLKKAGIGALFGAGLACLASAPVALPAILCAGVGFALSNKRSRELLDVAKTRLVNNARKVAENYANQIVQQFPSFFTSESVSNSSQTHTETFSTPSTNTFPPQNAYSPIQYNLKRFATNIEYRTIPFPSDNLELIDCRPCKEDPRFQELLFWFTEERYYYINDQKYPDAIIIRFPLKKKIPQFSKENAIFFFLHKDSFYFCEECDELYVSAYIQFIEKNPVAIKRFKLLKKLNSTCKGEHQRATHFEGFLHTTNFSNFLKIMEHGALLSRDEAIRSQFLMPEDDVADTGVISGTSHEITSKTRFYYYYNTPTNYLAKYLNPVILVFSKYLIFDSKAYFAEQNAGKHSTKLTQNIDEVLQFNWNAIFERGYYSQSFLHDPVSLEVSEEEKKQITAFRNAEFLFDGAVSTDYIVKVYFSSKEDYQKAVELFQESSVIDAFQPYNKNDDWRFHG